MVPPPAVLAAYPDAVRAASWERATGGFSGATVWCGSIGGVKRFALKQWPWQLPTGRLRTVHQYQSAVATLPFVSAIERTSAGESFVDFDGYDYDVCCWLPGGPDCDTLLSPKRLANAVAALDSVHRIWREMGGNVWPCPAVVRRLKLIEEYRNWLGPGLTPVTPRLPGAIDAAEARLRPWLGQRVPVHACFTDVRREHVLYTGDDVTGLIDFGAIKPDSPAADYARLFGDDPATLDAALKRTSGFPPELAVALAETAPAVNLAAWDLRLNRDGETPADPDAVNRRIAGWVDRLA